MSSDIEPIEPVGRTRRARRVALPDPRRRGLQRQARSLLARPSSPPPTPEPEPDDPQRGTHLDATA